MDSVPADLILDSLPGPKRGEWPLHYFRDEAVWSPSGRYFALAYSISEASMNNDVGYILWGARPDSSTHILGNPEGVLACCWSSPWCHWLNDDSFVFKIQSRADNKLDLSLIVVNVKKGFFVIPNSNDVSSKPDRLEELPEISHWIPIQEIGHAAARCVT